MAGRPGNDSKSTSPIFSFLFIFFWIWDALSIHHTSANVPLSLYRGCCVQVLLRAKPPSRAVRNDRCVVRRSNVFFFKKIPIGQIEIFFFLFSRSVLIRRRTKNARAYCVLKTRPLFSHSPRKELNPQDGHLILLPFWFTRKWTGENSYESCWLYYSSLGRLGSDFLAGHPIQVRVVLFWWWLTPPVARIQAGRTLLIYFSFEEILLNRRRKSPGVGIETREKPFTVKWRAFRLSGAFLSSTWSEHRVRCD